jgi:universal stress protein E
MVQVMQSYMSAWPTPEPVSLPHNTPTSLFGALPQELKVQRRSELGELVRGFSLHDLDSQVHFLEDDPDYAISNLAATTLNIELIVMGTVCRTGLPGVLIGNTAENVLEQVNCSVLAVKPEGFTSPVTL